MTRNEAYKILGLESSASEADIKSAFRKLAAKTHPDRNNNSPESEAEFKKINEAYQTLNNQNSNQQEFTYTKYKWPQGNIKFDFGDIFFETVMNADFRSYHQKYAQATIIQDITITFRESILGVQKVVNCVLRENCKDCIDKNSEIVGCTDCDYKGYKEVNKNVQIRVPAGVDTGTTIRTLVDDAKGFRTEILFKINVEPHPTMKKVGTSVVSVIELTLLEALKGANKTVETVRGKRVLKIPPKINNGAEIISAGNGVPIWGNHVFKINVIYPNETTKLIEFLENEQVEKENQT